MTVSAVNFYFILLAEYMSDGNFNRNLLPYKNYQSGLRAGKAQMKIRSIAAMKQCLANLETMVTEDQRKEILDNFIKELGE